MKSYQTLLTIGSALLFLNGCASKKSSAEMLAPTPPLGWNSFDSYNLHIYEEMAFKEAEAMVEKFKDHGYEYFVLDSGWYTDFGLKEVDGYKYPVDLKLDPEDTQVDENGIMTPDSTLFPNGFKALIDYCHQNGLKFGFHVMRGIPRVAVHNKLPIKDSPYTADQVADVNDICVWNNFMYGVDMSKPGAQDWYDSLIQRFADWGVDFIKVDDVVHKPAEIEAYAKAIEKCGRPMMMSISPGRWNYKNHIDTYKKAQMLRITQDIWDTPESIEVSFTAWQNWQGLEEPGFWPDLDMIPFGELCKSIRTYEGSLSENEIRQFGKPYHWCKLNEAQKETFITQRALSASPLFIGGSMMSMDEHSVSLLTNAHMLECNQNGVSGRLMKRHEDGENAGLEIYLSPEKNSGFQKFREARLGWVGVFNRTDKPKSFEVNRPKLLELDKHAKYAITDVWSEQNHMVEQGKSRFTLDIEPYGVAFLRFDRID